MDELDELLEEQIKDPKFAEAWRKRLLTEGHLLECALMDHPSLECTCKDTSPDWTI